MYAHPPLLNAQMAAVAAPRRTVLQIAPAANREQGRQWLQLPDCRRKGRGYECWHFWAGERRRSGESAPAQGLPKAESQHGHRMTTEVAWHWRRDQPDSALSSGFRERFGSSTRLRRIGSVAVARQFFIALWRCLTTGVFPEGAALGPVSRRA